MVTRFIFVIVFFTTFVVSAHSQVSIIPEPVSFQQKEGAYSVKNKIAIAGEASLKKIAEGLKEKLSVTGLPVSIVPTGEKADIHLSLNKSPNTTIGKEGYQFAVSASDGVRI